MTANEVRELLVTECRKAAGQNKWADAHDLSGAYVSDVIMGRREPGESICEALGIVRVISYKHI